MVQQHLEKAAEQAGIDPAAVQPSAEARALVADSANLVRAPPMSPPRGRLSPQQRDDMIRGMVDRLSARLTGQPR